MSYRNVPGGIHCGPYRQRTEGNTRYGPTPPRNCWAYEGREERKYEFEPREERYLPPSHDQFRSLPVFSSSSPRQSFSQEEEFAFERERRFDGGRGGGGGEEGSIFEHSHPHRHHHRIPSLNPLFVSVCAVVWVVLCMGAARTVGVQYGYLFG